MAPGTTEKRPVAGKRHDPGAQPRQWALQIASPCTGPTLSPERREYATRRFTGYQKNRKTSSSALSSAKETGKLQSCRENMQNMALAVSIYSQTLTGNSIQCQHSGIPCDGVQSIFRPVRVLVMTAHVITDSPPCPRRGLPGIYFLYLACDISRREGFVVAGDRISLGWSKSGSQFKEFVTCCQSCRYSLKFT